MSTKVKFSSNDIQFETGTGITIRVEHFPIFKQHRTTKQSAERYGLFVVVQYRLRIKQQ